MHSRDEAATDAQDLRHNWHPFTQMSEYTANPRLHVTHGKGCWLHDASGKRYLDGNAAIWTNVHGYCDPELDEAIREQSAAFAHATYFGLCHAPGAELAARLSALTQGKLTRTYYSDNGSGAVEIALKLSLQYWQLVGQPKRTGIIAMRNAYHGDTFGTMSVGDNGIFHERFKPWFFSVERFPGPHHVESNHHVHETDNGATALAALDTLLDAQATSTACLILEPSVQGAAGMRLQPPGFVRAVAARCRQHGIHLVLDEIFVGFGRLGVMLASEAAGVTPDFLCLSKGLAAGYFPLAATLTNELIYEKFLGPYDEYRAFYHGHTFTGNPMACAVALKNIEKLERMMANGMLDTTQATFGKILEETLGGHPNVAQIRQRGMTAAVDLRPRHPSQHWEANWRAGFRVCLEARNRGLILRPLGDTLLFVPPLIINPEEIALMFRTTREAMDTVLHK
jgi:adenosylmethionine-8-amino-7-oxononanoate aminotransferase